MKITRRQLRRIIRESLEDDPRMKRFNRPRKEPKPGELERVQAIYDKIRRDDPDFAAEFMHPEDEEREKARLARLRETTDYPAGYEPTNVDRVYEIIQPLLDASNVGADRQGEIAMEVANLYDATVDNPDEIYGHAEEILKTDAGYHDEDEEEEQRYAAGRPWEHN